MIYNNTKINVHKREENEDLRAKRSPGLDSYLSKDLNSILLLLRTLTSLTDPFLMSVT